MIPQEMKYGDPVRVLCLEGRPGVSAKLQAELADTGEVETTRSQAEFEAFVRRNRYHLVVAESLPGWPALEALRLLQRLDPGVPFLAVADASDEDMAIECLRQGAADYVLKDRPARLTIAVRRALEEKVPPVSASRAKTGRWCWSRCSPRWRTRSRP